MAEKVPVAEASPEQVASARTIMGTIWSNFHAKREESRSGAYRQLLDDLTKYADNLVPYVIGLKDFVGLCFDIETYLKGASGETGQTPLDHLKEFLNAPIDIPPEVSEDDIEEADEEVTVN